MYAVLEFQCVVLSISVKIINNKKNYLLWYYIVKFCTPTNDFLSVKFEMYPLKYK